MGGLAAVSRPPAAPPSEALRGLRAGLWAQPRTGAAGAETHTRQRRESPRAWPPRVGYPAAAAPLPLSCASCRSSRSRGFPVCGRAGRVKGPGAEAAGGVARERAPRGPRKTAPARESPAPPSHAPRHFSHHRRCRRHRRRCRRRRRRRRLGGAGSPRRRPPPRPGSCEGRQGARSRGAAARTGARWTRELPSGQRARSGTRPRARRPRDHCRKTCCRKKTAPRRRPTPRRAGARARPFLCPTAPLWTQRKLSPRTRARRKPWRRGPSAGRPLSPPTPRSPQTCRARAA
mmetsp:Transcript_43195/g.85195  ORF Transcript_43195/g.85195 Transcript_43195/m.85195 type:complete len:289 (-) Transcript_43195:579-1445(-)